MVAKDDPDESVVSNGTTIAECEAGSRILAARLYIRVFGMDANEVQRLILAKNPRNLLSADNFMDSQFLAPTSTTIREVHGAISSSMTFNADNTARSGQTVRLRLGRRHRFMNDLDQLELIVKLNGTAAKVSIFGTIKWLKP